MIRKKMLRLLLCDYQRADRYYTIYRTFKSLSSDDFTTIPRLFPGETTTIGYDYFSRNATTIADLYWLSGESPKRVAAVAANGSAPPAAPLLLDCSAGLAWPAVCCTVWHGFTTGAPLHPYIHYYNRAAALACTAPGVAQAVL